MPCNGDYLDATDVEKHSKEVCQHLLRLLKALNNDAKLSSALKRAVAIPKAHYDAIKKGAADAYGDVDNFDMHVALLCRILSNMKQTLLNKYVYDGKNAECRALADWWAKHQKADALQKLSKEVTEAESDKLLAVALNRLTDAELSAIRSASEKQINKFRSKKAKE